MAGSQAHLRSSVSRPRAPIQLGLSRVVHPQQTYSRLKQSSYLVILLGLLLVAARMLMVDVHNVPANSRVRARLSSPETSNAETKDVDLKNEEVKVRDDEASSQEDDTDTIHHSSLNHPAPSPPPTIIQALPEGASIEELRANIARLKARLGDAALSRAPAAASSDASWHRPFQPGAVRLRGTASGSGSSPLESSSSASGKLQLPTQGTENRSDALLWTDWLRAETDISINLKAWVPAAGVTMDDIRSGKVAPSELQNFRFPDVHASSADSESSAKMEHGYRDVEIEAEFLPRLPETDWKPSYGSCAVVGNSGTILGKGFGSEIDSHDAVMRINYAPTDGFEEDVGTKTTLDLCNKENTMLLLKGQHKWRDSTLLLFEGHSRIIRKNVYRKLYMATNQNPQEHHIIMMNPALVTLSRSIYNAIKADLELEVRGVLQGTVTDPAKVERAQKMHQAKLASSPAGAEDTTKEGFAFHSKPMSGITAVYTAMQLCGAVDMYGFDPYSESTTTPYHYFDTRAAMTWVHSFDLAIEVYRSLGLKSHVTMHT